MGAATALATVGTAITALIVGVSAAALFGFSTNEGLLLGAILSSTDGAAIFALLRGSALSRKLAQTLEGESGLNDPVAVVLVLGFIEVLTQPAYGVGDFILLFVRQLGIGLAVGLLVGAAAVYVLRRIRLATAGLYPVASLTVAALAFGGADTLHGSGCLAVYLAGLMLGSATIPAERTIVNFHQGLGWLAQVAMFLTLGLLVFPSQTLLGSGQGHGPGVRAGARRPPGRRRGRDSAVCLQLARARAVGVGRPAWSRSRRAGHLPGDRARPAPPAVLQHRLLRRARIHGFCRGRPSRHLPAASV